jgi:predicted  nucleic acid-binding Zn-ribbon protein
MADEGGLDAAVKRLASALDALDVAVERRREFDQNDNSLAHQLHALGTDRSRLAATLDQQVARVRTLETANREIAQRVDVAMETIRGVIEANDR